ncbi:hypothetical protein ACVWWN_004649 [Mycobacterium sp. URHB0021]
MLRQLELEADWLDVRFCAAEDDETFYAGLRDAHVIWRVRPEWRSLAELLAVSDIVSLHLPLTDRIHHLLDRAAVASMKPGARRPVPRVRGNLSPRRHHRSRRSRIS